MYHDLCCMNSEKIVAGFYIKHCNKVGGEWIIRSNRNPISSSKKELAQPYPASTTEVETDVEAGAEVKYNVFSGMNLAWI